jgi:hypothetical protein
MDISRDGESEYGVTRDRVKQVWEISTNRMTDSRVEETDELT